MLQVRSVVSVSKTSRIQPPIRRVSSAATTRIQPASPTFPVVSTCPSPTCACTATPAGLDIERKRDLNGSMAPYAQHVVISTGKSDWTSRIEDDGQGTSWGDLGRQLKAMLGRGGKYSDVRWYVPFPLAILGGFPTQRPSYDTWPQSRKLTKCYFCEPSHTTTSRSQTPHSRTRKTANMSLLFPSFKSVQLPDVNPSTRRTTYPAVPPPRNPAPNAQRPLRLAKADPNPRTSRARIAYNTTLRDRLTTTDNSDLRATTPGTRAVA